MRHKLDTIVFAQGWLTNQLEKAAESQTTEAGTVVAATVLEQWKLVDEGLDDLIKENKRLTQVVNDISITLGDSRLRTA